MPKPLKYEQITGLSTVKSLTPPTGDRAYHVLIQAEAQAIRWRDDGTNPSATVGMLIPVNATLEYDGDLNKIRLIEAAASGIANVSYYGV